MTTQTTYTSWTDAVQALVIDPIEADGVTSAREYDIDAIAMDVITMTNNHEWASAIDADEFWQVVQTYAREQ